MRATIAATLLFLAGPASAAPALPLVFEQNQGQVDGPIRYLARRPGFRMMLGPAGALLLFEDGRRLRMELEGTSPLADLDGEGALSGRAHYLMGRDPAAWLTDIPLFAQVVYREIYPHVDLVMRGGEGDVLEYDFHVAPGGDPGELGLRFSGCSLRVGDGGDLELDTGGGVLVQRRPAAYQEIAGARQEVESRFVLRGPDRVGFEVGAYDPALPLVIDPPFSYSTFIGGDGSDRVNAIALDADGQVYVAGETTSLAGPLALDFPSKGPIPGGDQLGSYPLPPTEPRPFPSIRKYDAFVGKLDTTQTGPASLVYMTFFGGALGDDRAWAVAVDGDGRAHVGGTTSSRDLPLVHPLQTCTNAAGDFVCDLNISFLARLSPAGDALEYASFLNGNNVDEVRALAVGPQGRLYVGGRTASAISPTLPVPPSSTNYNFYFPLTPTAVQAASHGIFDAFIMVLDLSKTDPAQQLVYSTLLGGCADDEVQGLAVDATGRAAVSGTTQNPCANPATAFPLASPFQATYKGGLTDAFVAAIDPAVAGAAGLVFSSFLGGAYDENDLRSSGLALDGAGNVYVAGTTSSHDFPTTAGAAQRCPGMTATNALLYPCDPQTGVVSGSPPNGTVIDGTLAVISPAGQLVHSTYVGGAGQDTIQDIDVRPDGGFAYVTGSTTSTGLGSTCAPQPSRSLGRDAFQATLRLAPNGAGLSSTRDFFTYLGGGADDFAFGVAYDGASKSTFVGGYTTFNTTSFAFPTTGGALQPVQPSGTQGFGGDNGFLTQIAKPAACGPDLVIRKIADPEPASPGCPLAYTIEVQNLGVASATQVTVTDPLPAAVTLASATSTLGTCSGQTTVICALGTLAVGQKATITLIGSVDPGYASTQPPLVNTATVASSGPDNDPADNSATAVSHLVASGDADGDGGLDCVDACPDDPAKSEPGVCGCGVADEPAVSVDSPTATEGDAALFTVSLAAPTCVDLSFTYATQAGSAAAGEDFADTSGAFTILAGSTSYAVPVATLPDTLVEGDESFALAVAPAGAGEPAAGTATIVDDDFPPSAALAGPTLVTEGGAYLYLFTVTASGPFTVSTASCGAGSLVGAVSTDAGGGSFSCVFPDGPAATQVELQVESGGASSEVAALLVTVLDVAPQVSLAGDGALDEGHSGLYAFVVTDPGSDGFVLAGDPDCGAAGLLVAGSLQLDPGGAGGSFECWFPDGDAAGTIGVAVVDEDGATSATATFGVVVANVPPSVMLDGATSAAEGETVTYQLSVYDPGDEAVAVDFADCGQAGALVPSSLVVAPAQGDGGLKAEGSFQCVFPSGPTTSTVSAAAADSAGPGPTAQLQVVVGDTAPSVILGGAALVDEGQAGQFSFTVDAGSDSFGLAPGFPDCGLTGSLVSGSLVLGPGGGAFACSFANGPATAVVRVQVVDSDGKGSNIATQAVAVSNVVPVIGLSGPSSVSSGATATFQIDATDDGGDPLAASAGTPDCGANGALVAGSLALGPGGGSFQCAFGQGPMTSTVTVKLVDADGGESAPASVTVTIAAPVLQAGWMVGHGTVASSFGPAQLAFSISCDAGVGQESLHVNAGLHKLKLETLSSSACSDDPAIDPGLPAVPFDTLIGAGTGRYDGVAGFPVTFAFTDAGEPGGSDLVSITVTNSQGNVVLSATGLLSKGNNDAQQ